MIRKRLGNYYNINPNHIEIWLPQYTYSYSGKWDYGSKGRGKWNGKLETLLSDGRHEWNDQCTYFLSFFDFNDGQYTYYTDYKINTKNESDIYDKYFEQEFRLKCIEETLEIIGMNGGIPIDCDIISDISDSDNDEENEFKQLFGQ